MNRLRISVHEELARFVKAGKILAAIDAAVGYCTGDDAEIVSTWIGALDAEAWEQLADVAGCNPPGPKTVVLVLESVRARSRKAAS